MQLQFLLVEVDMLLGQHRAHRHGLATTERGRRQRRYVREELIEEGLADLADGVVVRGVIDLDPVIGVEDPSLKLVEAGGDTVETAVEGFCHRFLYGD